MNGCIHYLSIHATKPSQLMCLHENIFIKCDAFTGLASSAPGDSVLCFHFYLLVFL